MKDIILNNTSEYISHGQSAHKNWRERYELAWNNIYHDEPWLTYIAIYSLFPNPNSMDGEKNIVAFNKLLKNSGANASCFIRKINSIKLEVREEIIKDYSARLYDLYSDDALHLYPDRSREVRSRIDNKKRKTSLEGGTNIDCVIEAVSEEGLELFIIEAKFLSDISYQTKYNPVRDQIVRTIDSKLSEVLKENLKAHNLHFLLLTPKLFRIPEYGSGKVNNLAKHHPERSRLYCYKMKEYKNPVFLKSALPHRENISDSVWQEISDNIGWITFEDIIHLAEAHEILPFKEKDRLINFFKERNLYE